MSKIKGKFQAKISDQYSLVVSLILLFYGYFGLIANFIMFDDLGHQLVYTQIDTNLVIWNFLLYPQTYFSPLILLLFVSLFHTVVQDIPEIGIKGAIWFVPFLLGCSIHWFSKIKSPFTPAISLLVDGNFGSLFQYWGIRLSYAVEGLGILFGHWQGYVMVFILILVSLTGALGGKYLKIYIIYRRNRAFKQIENKETFKQDMTTEAK